VDDSPAALSDIRSHCRRQLKGLGALLRASRKVARGLSTRQIKAAVSQGVFDPLLSTDSAFRAAAVAMRTGSAAALVHTAAGHDLATPGSSRGPLLRAPDHPTRNIPVIVGILPRSASIERTA